MFVSFIFKIVFFLTGMPHTQGIFNLEETSVIFLKLKAILLILKILGKFLDTKDLGSFFFDLEKYMINPVSIFVQEK